MRTASYRRWTPNLGVPVRTSLGVPAWFQAPLLELRVAYPWGLLTRPRLEPEEFTTRYRARLDQRRHRVLAVLAELREGYGDVVLLCFERSDTFCHRHVLRAWLAEQLGEKIQEIGGGEGR